MKYLLIRNKCQRFLYLTNNVVRLCHIFCVFIISATILQIILSHSLLEGSNFLSDADDDDLIGIQSLEQSGVCLVSRSGKISIWDTEDNKVEFLALILCAALYQFI